uniref:DRBM domain-containing protein n=1 Tax=Photinus pyralis TaxID=7054 RepID=A0A1Y1MYD4_PHOPY
MSEIKSFLHQFCQKNKVEPQFEVRPTGPKHRQRFLCEVRVAGYTYVGAGNSTNKKDAQSNASRDFVSFLVRQGHVNSKDVPTDLGLTGGNTAAPDSGLAPSGPQHSVFREGTGPASLGEAYKGVDQRDGQWSYMDRVQQQKQVEEAEDLDVNAQIHGNWTIENAKSKLHQFLQSNKINTDYRYSPIGPDHTKLSLVKLNFLFLLVCN